MNILLLNPPTRSSKKFIREGRCTQEQGVWAALWPPVSLAMMGAVLENSGHGVTVIDCPARDVNRDALLERIGSLCPGAVLWSTGTPSIVDDLSLAEEIKKIDKGIVTAVFGTHVTALDRQCMEDFPHLDCIIRNEPEVSALELVRALERGDAPETVAGLTVRDAGKKIVATPPRPFLEDLDSLPLPAWHLLALDCYRLPLKGRRFLIVAPQRGCPFDCSFCTCQAYYGKRLRKRSAAEVIAEIEHDISRFDIRDFFIWSETFVVDKSYVAELCAMMLDRNLDISWTCNSRVDRVDADLLALMARAGCWMISYGIESGDQGVLDRAAKGITVDQIHTAVRLTKRAGIKTAAHFILGLPGETQQSMEKTITLAKKLGVHIAQFYAAVPFPGSRLYEQARQQGWIKEQEPGAMNQDHAVMELPGLSAETVNRYRRRAYRSFYFRPAALLRILGMLAPGDIPKTAKAAWDFMRWSA